MKRFIYSSRRIQKTIRSNPGYKGILEKYFERIDVTGFMPQDRVGKKHYYQTNPRNDLRLICEIIPVIHEQVAYEIFFIHELFSKQSSEYAAIERTANKIEYIEKHPPTVEEKNEIIQEIKEYLNKKSEENKLLDLPIELEAWCAGSSLKLEKSNVFETEEWINSSSKYGKNRNSSIRDLLEEMLNDNCESERVGKKTRNTILVNNKAKDLFLLAEKFSTTTRDEIWMLYEVFSGSKPSPESINKCLDRYNHDIPINQDILKSDAKRAYPDYIVLGKDTWRKIQDDTVANLALSPEEEFLLQDVKYPVFINGQAGSGKTTMLLYLFAHFCRQKNSGTPIYLTYNKTLLETAKENVVAILSSHHSSPEEGVAHDDISKVKEYFFPFQSFILEKLVCDEGKFPPNKYISYNRFKAIYSQIGMADKQMFCQLGERKRFSPELAWHLIRTFIKGFEYSHYLSPENYRQINRDDRTVTDEDYSIVFNSIWNSWYKSFWEKNGYWDDQDLIRYVIANWKDTHPKYPVVFCDESQDFTRIEIELILRISEFTKYNLSYHENIPFAFAGDPYQSINPTGFRWDNLKYVFNSQFRKLNSYNPDIHFASLTKNYRSKPSVIRFANLIQLFRRYFFSITDLLPQQPWQKEEGLAAKFYEVDKTISSDDLKNYNMNIIIIPADAGYDSEALFAKGDNHLKNFAESEKGKSELHNVMNASTAKGLEFDRVILYKFGEHAPKCFEKLFKEDSNISDSESIELSHYFNKLYVAVTRAKDFLFVFDTSIGYQRFWRYFTEAEHSSTWLSNVNGWDVSNIKHLEIGDSESKNEIQESNYGKIAEQFEIKGLQAQDAKLLESAAGYYKYANNNYKRLRCSAFAAKYSKQFDKAGYLFEQQKEFGEALQCYWEGCLWKNLIGLNYSKGNVAHSRVLLAKYMDGMVSIDEIIKETSSWLQNIKRHETPFDKICTAICAELKKKSIELPADIVDYISFAKNLLDHYGTKFLTDTLAYLYFVNDNFVEAAKLWEEIGEVATENYYKTKVETSTDINDKIKWLSLLNNTGKELFKIWTTIEKSTLNTESLKTISTKLRNEGRNYEALAVPAFDFKSRIREFLEKEKGEDAKLKAVRFMSDIENQREGLEFINDTDNPLFSTLHKAFNDFLIEQIEVLNKLEYALLKDFETLPILFALVHRVEFTSKLLPIFSRLAFLNQKESTSADRVYYKVVGDTLTSSQQIDFIAYVQKKFIESNHEWSLETWKLFDDIFFMLRASLETTVIKFYGVALNSSNGSIIAWANKRIEQRVVGHIYREKAKNLTPEELRKVRELELEVQILRGNAPVVESVDSNENKGKGTWSINNIAINSLEEPKQNMQDSSLIDIPTEDWDFVVSSSEKVIQLSHKRKFGARIVIEPLNDQQVSLTRVKANFEERKWLIEEHNVSIEIFDSTCRVIIGGLLYEITFGNDSTLN